MNADRSRAVAQDAVTARYNTIARFYDLFDKPMDLIGVRRRRKRLLSHATGKTLEVGGAAPAGTSGSIPTASS